MAGFWDPRLITPERALALTMGTPLWLDVCTDDRGQLQAHLRCIRCGQSTGLYWSAAAEPMLTSTDDVVSGVLRHLVVAHDQSLSGTGRNNERDNRGSSPDGGAAPAAGPGPASSGDSAGPAGH